MWSAKPILKISYPYTFADSKQAETIDFLLITSIGVVLYTNVFTISKKRIPKNWYAKVLFSSTQ